MSIQIGNRLPGFDDPLAMLQACHDKVRHFSTLSIALSTHLQEKGNDAEARSAAQAILRYFDLSAPLHHADEEQDLFPALAGVAPPALQATLQTLQQEHEALAGLWQHLRKTLVAIIEQRSDALPVTLAREFAQRYQQHAEQEEVLVFTPAATLLAANVLRALGERMAARRQEHD